MIRRCATGIAAVGALLLAGSPAGAAGRAGSGPAGQALTTFDVSLVAEDAAAAASRLCIDVMSGRVKLPAPGADSWWRAYKLDEGMPRPAMDALGPKGMILVAGATLARGVATDGDFLVALGGSAGETCRLIVYRAARPAGLAERTAAAMTAPGLGWKALPTPPRYAVAGKLSLLLRRDGKPYLANLLTPTTPDPVVMTIVVAAVPPQVTLPPGF